MDDKRKLTGHPWHVGFLKMAEDDTRRHKRRCIYYVRENCCRKCGICVGSSHCSFYKESAVKQSSRQQINQQQINQQKIDQQKIDQQQIEELLRKIFGE